MMPWEFRDIVKAVLWDKMCLLFQSPVRASVCRASCNSHKKYSLFSLGMEVGLSALGYACMLSSAARVHGTA